MNEDTNFVLDGKVALPNKLLQSDGSITDITGKSVTASVESYDNKPALPNKFLNPDGTYSTLNEIIASMVDTSLFVIVDELPASGNEEKIYLVPDGKGGFTEYHWTGSKWDPIGVVEIDLSQYSTTEEMMAAITVALNQAKSYTDTQIAGIEFPQQVFYWNGVAEQPGLNTLTSLYELNQKSDIIFIWNMYGSNTKSKYITYLAKNYLNTSNGTSVIYGDLYNEGENNSDVSYHDYYVQQELWVTYENGKATKVSSKPLQGRSYLDTETNYGIPYIPKYAGSPATKKYVDDSIANSITSALEESY